MKFLHMIKLNYIYSYYGYILKQSRIIYYEKDKENINLKWIFPNSGISAQKSEFICQKIFLLCL